MSLKPIFPAITACLNNYVEIYIMKAKNKNFPFDITAIMQEWAEKDGFQIPNHKIVLTTYRPFSIVCKIELKFSDSNSGVYYLKYYQREANKNKPEVVERDFNTTQFWNDHFKDHKEFNVIKPVYYNAEKYILISEESKGQNLSQLINKYGQLFPSENAQKKLTDMLALVGRWLRYFQSIPIEGQYEKLGLDYFLDYVEIRLNRLVENDKVAFDAPLKERVIAFMKRQWEQTTTDDLKYSYIHSDLSLSNVLIHKDSITVLDFNEKETGLIYKDLTRLYHQLHLLYHKPVYPRHLIKDLKTAFLRGYGNEETQNHPLFKMYQMVHIINHLGKTARYWEHDFIENLYNRWMVRNTLKELNKLVAKP